MPQELPIWTIFNPAQLSLLRGRAIDFPVNQIAESRWQKLFDNLVFTMERANGIGLAAPQIGISIRIMVISAAVGRALTDPQWFINPTLSNPSPAQDTSEEGCLSIPGVYGLVPRAKAVSLRAFNRHGQLINLTASDLFARVIQHEVDHLNGRLFIDRAVSLTHGQELLP